MLSNQAVAEARRVEICGGRKLGKMRKSCELCKSPARMYCESDQASLCWDCDAKVHSANFLVARHSRSLLCHVCQLPTAWNASGAKLGPTVSVCVRCLDGCDSEKDEAVGGVEERESGDNDEIDTEDRSDEDDDDDDDDDEEEVPDEDEDGDNQVVPWSSTPPPPVSCTSSSEESSSRFSSVRRDGSLKRMRHNVSDLRSDDDISCSSSYRNRPTTLSPSAAAASYGGGEAAFVVSLSMRPSRTRRIEANQSQQGLAGPRSTAAIVESLRRFHEQDVNSGNDVTAAIDGICRLSRNTGAVDFNPAESP